MTLEERFKKISEDYQTYKRSPELPSNLFHQLVWTSYELNQAKECINNVERVLDQIATELDGGIS